MIRSFACDDPRLKQISADPLISTIIESAAQQCGGGIRYDFWGMFSSPFSRKAEGWILKKGHSLWATAETDAAAEEIAEFLQFQNEGWLEADARLSALWGEGGTVLTVMQYPAEAALTLPDREYCTNCATAVVDCNRAVGEITASQYEAAVVGLHLAHRRGVGHSVTLQQGGKPVSAAAVIDQGSRFGQISYVATLPEQQGNGLGRAVVLHEVQFLRQKGLTPLVACEAHRVSFYRELGFEVLGTNTVFCDGV